MLAVLVGALEVPAGTLDTIVKLVCPSASCTGSCIPGVDGFIKYELNDTSANGWAKSPSIP
ncbi:MAG: hypothetical protein ACPGQV_19830 [Alphaproteobacteria bacterium]